MHVLLVNILRQYGKLLLHPWVFPTEINLIYIWDFHFLGDATKGLCLHGTLAGQLINKDFHGKTE